MMKKNILTTIISIVLFLSTNPIHSQPEKNDSLLFNLMSFNNLDITIKAVRSESLMPYVPILLQIEIANPTEKDIVIPELTFSEYYKQNVVDILYGHDHPDSLQSISYVKPYFGPMKEGVFTTDIKLVLIEPGKTLTLQIPISYDWFYFDPVLIAREGNLFLQTVNYAVKANKEQKLEIDHNNSISSNIIKIEIPKARGIDSLALEELLKMDCPWLICAPVSADYHVDKNDFDNYLNFIQLYPNTIYTIYIKALLAHIYANGGSYDIIKVVEPDLQKARNYIKDLLKDDRFILTEDVNELNEKINMIKN